MKSILTKLRHFYEDLRDDWRDLLDRGPKSWLRGFSEDLKSSRDSLVDLKERATAKLPEEERAAIKELRRKKRAERLHDVRESLQKLITLPWRMLVGLGGVLKNFREQGFRHSVADLWSGYVSWVGRFLEWCFGFWRRFVGFPIWLRVVTGTLFLIIIIGAGASPWLIDEVRNRRAQEMLEQAKAGLDEDDLVEAYRKSRAAALMRPDDPEALELVLELSNSVGTPEAIWWSERVSSIHGQDAESMNRVIETALRHRRLDKAERSFASLKSRHPNHESIAEVEVGLLLARSKHNEALRRALVAIEAGDDSAYLHTTVVDLGIRSSSADVRQRVFEHLIQNLYRNDEVGLAMARLVFTRGIRPPEGEENLLDYNRLITFIESHEEATAVDRASAYSIALRMESIPRETAESKILEQFDLENRDELLSVVRGLGALGLYESYGRIIPAELIAEEADFALARITGLIFQEEPDLDTAEALLNRTSENAVARISQAKTAFWNAVIADQRGDSEAMAVGIVTALESASTSEWGYFIENLPQVADTSETLLFYSELFERSGRNPLIAARYLRLAYNHAEEGELAKLVQGMPLELIEHDPLALSLLIYLKLLYDEESRDASRYHAEKLVAEQPTDIGHLISLAHVYARSEQFGRARRLIEFWDSEGKLESLPPYLQLSYLLVTGKDAGFVDRDSLHTSRERELLDQLTKTNSDASEHSG